MHIRNAKPTDTRQLLTMMRGLARFEGYLAELKLTEQELTERLFKRVDFQCFVAEQNGVAIGYLVYYVLPFSYDLTPWLWVKELYVADSTEHRRKGVGKALMGYLIQEAHKRGSAKIKWEVLSSNINAKAFYRQLGASQEKKWEVWSLNLQTEAG
ncbi:GNAT family N-acetyltransferase [Microbulbifer sp. SSSA002]|uniref:GNAT family N-acetyltransferase n=1 Tax=Microbulbifer sp. SSSA002 TaxID=3243376 RepID=UPI004039B636